MSELLAGNTETSTVRARFIDRRDDLDALLMAIDEDARQGSPDITGYVSGVIPCNFERVAKAFCKRNRLAFAPDAEFELRLQNRNYYLVCSHGIDC